MGEECPPSHQALDCAIFIGIQGSGKTTFYRRHFASTHAHISKDDFPHARDRNERQRTLILQALQRGESVAIDNTNTTQSDRAPLIAFAKSLGVTTTAYYFDAVVRDCLRRNRGRAGKQRIPEAAIYAAARRIIPPSRKEGFDRIFRVRVLPDDTFSTAPLPD